MTLPHRPRVSFSDAGFAPLNSPTGGINGSGEAFFSSRKDSQGLRLVGVVTILATALLACSGCQWAAGGQNATGARLYEQGQYTAAMQEFQKAINSDPTNADGYYNLAATTHRLAVQRQDTTLLTQAESLYNQCLDHAADHVECHRGLAVLLVDSDRTDKAFALLKNWASRNPQYAEPRIELARLYEEAGNPQVAQKYLEDAVKQDASNQRAWYALARLRDTKGDHVQALQNYQRALVLGANGPAVTERIASLSRQINSDRDSSLSGTMGPAGGTTIARPMPLNRQRY